MERLILVVAPTTVGARPHGATPLPEDTVVVGLTTTLVQGQVVATNGLAEGEPGRASSTSGVTRVPTGRTA